MNFRKLVLLPALLLAGSLFAEENLLLNGSFEEANPDGTAKGWSGKAPVYQVSSEFARTGKKSLYFKNMDEKKYSLCAQTITDTIKAGGAFRFGVYAKTRNVKGDGPTVCVEFWDGDKYLGGQYPNGLKSTNGEWALADGTIRYVPERANKITLTVYCRERTTGEAWFDDAFLEPYYPPLLSVHTTDAYRNQIDGSRDISVYAQVGVKGGGTPEKAAGLKLTVYGKDGKAIATSMPQKHDSSSVRFPIATRKLAAGTYTYKIEALKDNGEMESVEGSFTRVDAYPARKSYIDDHRRLIVDGKPFFPLGLYFGGIGEDYELFRDSAFNCIMPYHAISRADLDRLYKDGKSVVYSVKDNYPNMGGCKTQEEADAKTAKMIGDLKDHPGIIAWYINDELPLKMLKTLSERRDFVEKLDPGRPSWVVLYQYQEIRDYLPSYDVIGTDPYPIGIDSQPDRALVYARLTTDGAFGVRANWMVPQVFNWSAYWLRYGKSVEEILKCKAPTYKEMKSMTWMCVAGGATGLIYYSWFDLIRMSKVREFQGAKLPADNLDQRWAEIKKMAAEVKEHEDVLLAIDPAIGVKLNNAPAGIGMRAFGKGDETWLLLVNSYQEKAVACNLEAENAVQCKGITLGTSQPKINGKAISIELQPLEAVFLRLVRK